MAKAALELEILTDWNALRFHRQGILPPLLDFVQRENPGCHSQKGDFHRKLRGKFPSWRAGRKNMDEAQALGLPSLTHFIQEIFGEGRGSRSRIRDAVGGHDFHNILFGSILESRVGSGGGPAQQGGCRASLDARIHVAFVVITDVNDVVVPLGAPRKGLQSDVERPPIPSPSHYLNVLDTSGHQSFLYAGGGN